MGEIFVLAEHRMGGIRDITFEILTKGKELCEKTASKLSTVILGKNVGEMADRLADYSDEVLVVENDVLENFNSDVYQMVLSNLIKNRKPTLTLMGHTAYGMDLAPSLAAELNVPLVTDCVDVKFENGGLIATKQMYGGKVNAEVKCKSSETYILTIRPAVFPPQEKLGKKAEITKLAITIGELNKKYLGLIEPEVGEVDITKADVVVSVGRGFGDKKNVPLADGLAAALGGVTAGSRPAIDYGWLPKDRQVGSSGKTVNPKLYLALGISGSFQHVMGMKGAKTIIAVNKDSTAPIFGVAHYGIVANLFDVVPALTEEAKKARGAKG